MAELRTPEELMARYPEGGAMSDNPGMPYATFGQEAAYTVALGDKPEIAGPVVACGLRPAIWQELSEAHKDFVSAQAHWGAARVFGIADASIREKAARVTTLRDELLDQADFYFTTSDDVQRISAIREGDGLADVIADARALVQLIRPRRQLILDPSFEPGWLDEALALAEVVEAALAQRSATSAVSPAGQEMRRVRDRIVARIEALQTEVRRFGKHAFRKDPKRRAAFASDYLRRKRRKGGGGEDPSGTGTAPPS